MVENCFVSSVKTKNDKVVGVETAKGFVECDIFVNAAGMWARKVGLMSEPQVKVPIHAVQHHYLYTHPVDKRNFKMPG